MKHLLRKLHLGGNSREDHPAEGSSSSSPLSNLADWFSSITRTGSARARLEGSEETSKRLTGSGSARARLQGSSEEIPRRIAGPGSAKSFAELPKSPVHGSQASAKPAIVASSGYESMEEEYQVQLALALSASNTEHADPELEAVKRISLGFSSAQAELVAYRYWADNVLNYDDKVVDGFYDVYGIIYDPEVPEKMPSLVDLQGEPVSRAMSSEVVLVNRLLDPELAKLEQRALVLLAACSGESAAAPTATDLAPKIATLVSEQMGGRVTNHSAMLTLWRATSWELRWALKSNVIPLGRLKVGLARHRALLFKVLADCVGIPCRLVKGKLFTGVDEGAVNIVKDAGNREYIVDLMADPGELIPQEACGSLKQRQPVPQIKDKDKAAVAEVGERHHSEPGGIREALAGPTERRTWSHLRSPSWTEGLGSPGVRRRNAKDVSQYVIDAAKENPGLAQRLHDVLLESGVVAPPSLFTDLPQQSERNSDLRNGEPQPAKGKDKGKPPLGGHRAYHHHLVATGDEREKLQRLHSVEGLGDRRPLEHSVLSASSSSAVSAAFALNALQDKFQAERISNSPVAASAITAAVVASSMVVAAAKIDNTSANVNLEMPISAAATATAAVVAATSAAAVVLKSENDSGKFENRGGSLEGKDLTSGQSGSGGTKKSHRSDGEPESPRANKADSIMQDVAEWEIPWEELLIGDRIGLGSYGEVYRGEWRGTEVAVKRFLDQDISGDALEEFITEVRLMKRMRHPNVVLFMGAVTRPPHLSIVTEFLPRGSLYKLLHRPSNQLDERRRLRMALDVAKGMNYLHTSNPVIVHRDLKSPNLLVDKNWVVKVCDFGLSRMKNTTFLSSKSQAGTPEWMAPEVLRNEPSNEKADIYSFGVILWELTTLQQPWQGMNPMQVVGAVGFQQRRLDIPDDMEPGIAKIIQECWHSDPNLRPSFAEIMAALRPLQLRSSSQQSRSPRG